MQINSVSGTGQAQPILRDEPRQMPSQSTAARAVGDSLPPIVEVPKEAVQAVDAKAQAEQINDAVKKINQTIGSMNKNVGLEFSTDEDTKLRLVKVIDVASKEVLRQIPTEEVINIAKAIDKLQGLLVRDKA
ncbi:flagellar protein FlaG [Chitinibacter fontanus]|uniref:Flagellar protein FlaG n=1 Tax=Chitinibacter fontanus TaxID=1737446 RepID=A0A7D5ZCR7_9NEIS|nr:flagellar protein FlaG [Chitinibacter fontanus]QLI80128.1 flagellar protein FlaG [Chitinibacter fontanus]